MKAISLWQPWASLCFTGYKKFETRHWATPYRGPLAIHAAQKLVTDLDDDLLALLQDLFGPAWPRRLPRGAMVGTATLVNCLSTEAFDADAIERLCGNWEPGRFAWRLEGARRFETPIAAKGRQGFFDWDDPSVPAELRGARLL